MEFDISGARIFWRIPTGIPILGDFLLTETLVVSWIVMAIITGLHPMKLYVSFCRLMV